MDLTCSHLPCHQLKGIFHFSLSGWQKNLKEPLGQIPPSACFFVVFCVLLNSVLWPQPQWLFHSYAVSSPTPGLWPLSVPLLFVCPSARAPSPGQVTVYSSFKILLKCYTLCEVLPNSRLCLCFFPLRSHGALFMLLSEHSRPRTVGFTCTWVAHMLPGLLPIPYCWKGH